MTTNPFRISNSELLCACGEISYLHNGKTTLSPAFEINEKAKIKLKIPRSLSANKIIISLYKSDDKKVISLNAVWYDFESVYDLYFIPLPIKDLNVGIYFFDIEIYSGFGITYAHNISNKIHFSEKKSSAKFQLSISNFEYPYPDDFSGGIIYHIFVDRFNKGGNCEKKEDKIIVQNWDEEIPEYPEYPGAPIKNN